MKLHKLFLMLVGASIFLSASALGSKTLSEARVYINPGHGGWGSNDRPMATINYAVLDTLGFFETNTDLIKALSLYDELEKAGVGYLKISRTKNGIVSAGTTKLMPGEVEEGNGQIVTLSVICQDVETNNMDYFLSIHSNAHTEASMTNYPLLLYRGTDAAPGNGLVEARNMALDAWKYIAKNDITYHSFYTTSSNCRGDISFGGSSSPNSLGYFGYYAVLKHGCDGFLSEGCFHTYQPERHRLLNDDYCRQEGVRYARAIRAWFGDNSETKGAIMGTVKDKYESLEHELYTYKDKSVDAHAPINEATVVLQDAQGNELDTYTTDKEYNGVYVFTDLVPGTYKLVYNIPGYVLSTQEITVVANETAFINQLMSDGREDPDPEPRDPFYPHPEQDGDVAAADSYEFTTEYELMALDVLKDLTIRRALLRDGKYYVLAVDAAKKPKLLVVDAVTGSLVKEMSQTGIVTEGYNGKDLPYILSDIAFTRDGVLIGTNSTVVGRENNAYQTGDFYMYKWQAASGTALEDATPQVVVKLPTNTSASLTAAGNNYSNFMANSIAVNGDINDFYFYFDSHAGDAWTTTHGYNIVIWRVKDGAIERVQRNTTEYDEKDRGEDIRFVYSPLLDEELIYPTTNIHALILDGDNIKPTEFVLNIDGEKIEKETVFAGEIPIEANGATYFRYVDHIYMSAPFVAESDGKYSYMSHLYDITDGLDAAKLIGETEAAIVDQVSIAYMTSTAVVDNADISQYLLVGNSIVKYTTKGQTEDEAIARIFAYNLKSVETTTGYDISYDLNESATSVTLHMRLAGTDSESLVQVPLEGLNKGHNTVSVPFISIPDDGQGYEWSIAATAKSVNRLVKISDDSQAFNFAGPKGAAIDKSPESDYFGRVYITNSVDGVQAGRTTNKGVYILSPDGSDITSQGDNAHTGGITWAAAAGESPRKVAVAADGRIFVCDFSVANSGIYYMNPETFAMTSIFAGANRESDGKITLGGTLVGGKMASIGVRGEAENTQIYTVDASASGVSWSKMIGVYNIGESNTWTTAPSLSLKPSSYVGNDNSSIAPVSTGFWAGQYRGEKSNSAGTPTMFYYSDAANNAVFNTGDAFTVTTSSQNGALAVNETERTVVLSDDGGASVYTYTMNESGVPTVTHKFHSTLSSSGVTYDDFEFDYAGNLYAVSYTGKLVSVWAMPTSDNTSITPAKRSMILVGKGVGVEEENQNAISVKIYPNPTTGYITIDFGTTINTVDVYSITGTLVKHITGVNAVSTNVDLGELTQGLYLVKINGGLATKLIKK